MFIYASEKNKKISQLWLIYGKIDGKIYPAKKRGKDDRNEND